MAADVISTVIMAAADAGQRVLNHSRGAGMRVLHKSDHSPVTAADLESHEFLCTILPRIRALPVVSEEAEACAIPPGQSYWLIDPLDGTKEFVDGNDEFCVNIALMGPGGPELGVIHAPALHETFFAIEGQGAHRLKDGNLERLRAQSVPREGWVLIRSRYHDSPAVNRFAQLNGLTRHVVYGASLKYPALASGRAQIYFREVGCSEWDIAPGHLILKETGGKLIDVGTGREMTYRKPGLRNGVFLAVSAGVDPGSLSIPK